MDFFVWWREMAVDGTLDTDSKWSYVVIDPNLDITYDYKPVDKTVRQKLYELHLPLNPDGTYGCTRNYDLYGSITSKDIVEKLKSDTGIDIDKRKVIMGDPIKAYGKYEVEVKLYTEVTGKINVLVCEK